MIANSSATSDVDMRTQPADAYRPIDQGRVVPWMPYLPHGTSRPIQYPPKPPPQWSFSVTRQWPIGVGESGAPTATRNRRTSRPRSFKTSVWSGVSTRIEYTGSPPTPLRTAAAWA